MAFRSNISDQQFKYEVAVYRWPSHYRSKIISNAMFRGIRACGDDPAILDANTYKPGQAHVAVFYGFQNNMRNAFELQKKCGGHAVYIDLGYFGRHAGGRWKGYHKISVDARHPTKYFQRRQHDHARFESHGIPIREWRPPGKNIIVAGMSRKAAEAEGFRFLEWEKKTIKSLQRVTDRPIVYRPKPSDRSSNKPIPGFGYCDPARPVDHFLKEAYCVVTHHSNVAIDAILYGVPAIVFGGVAVPMGSQSLKEIDNLPRLSGRDCWAANIAWTQFNISEMEKGLPWRIIKTEGLLK